MHSITEAQKREFRPQMLIDFIVDADARVVNNNGYYDEDGVFRCNQDEMYFVAIGELDEWHKNSERG